jgi:L,D-transpeptidase YbiS
VREQRIVINIQEQSLLLLRNNRPLSMYPVSTATNGPGEQRDSGCTPRGEHVIRAKIGAHLPCGAVFVGRRHTGETYSLELARQYPGRDWILTRILWLCGVEPGKNRYGIVDTMRRYIYIHGCPDTEPMGVPQSHGCIRMRNQDIIELFDRIEAGTPLSICEYTIV